MITGSDHGTRHVIEEVVFDFFFDSCVVADEHELLMNTWVVDELLPAVETALNEYDEKDKVLRIEQITIDLGDIPSSSADFPIQIIPRLNEQLITQLNSARNLGRSITQSSPQLAQPEGRQYIKPSVDGMTVQQVNPLQSNLEILEHFLTTGSMPWYVDATDLWSHEKLMEQVLLDAKGSAALCMLMVKIPPARCAVFVQRLVNQFSNKTLEKILIQIAPKQYELLLELVRAYQSVLSALQLPAMQQTTAMKLIWEQIFKAITGHAHVLGSFNFSNVMPQMLQRMAAFVLLDQNALIEKLILTSRNYSKDSRLPVILADQARELESQRNTQPYSEETEIGIDQETVNDSDPQHGEKASISEKSHHAPYAAVLFKQIKNALQQAEIDGTGSFLDNLHASDPQIIRKQLFEILQDKAIRKQIISRLPRFILIDVTYLLSPQAAIIIEQLLQYAGKLHHQTVNRLHITIAEWEQQFWENALSFLVSKPLKTLFEETRFVQALVRMPRDNEEVMTVLESWREILVKAQRQEHGALQNILFIAISTLKPKPQTILPSHQVRLIATGLETDFKRTHRRLKTAVETGRLVLEIFSVVELTQIIQALLKHTPSFNDTDGQMLIDAIKIHERKAGNSALFYQLILEKLIYGQVIDFDAIVSRSSKQDHPVRTEATMQQSAAQSTPSGADIYQRIASAIQHIPIPEKNLHHELVRIDDAQRIKTHLLDMLQNTVTHKQLMTALPKSVLIDIVYILLPQAALVLEQVLTCVDRQLINHSTTSRTWEKQLLENALNFLATQSDENLSPHSFNASTFLHEIAKGQSVGKGNKPVLEFCLENLQQQDYKNISGTNALHNIVLGTVSSASSVSRSYLTSQETKLIIAALENDYTIHRQQLRIAIETGSLVPEKLPEEMPRTIVQAVLKYDPALTDANKQTFIEAIESHARKAVNRPFYYQQVMEKLLSDETIDLEDMVLGAVRHDASQPAHDISSNTKATEKIHKKTDVAILQRIRSALKRFVKTGSDEQIEFLQTKDILSARKQLLQYLKDKTRRTRFIIQLPQSVLLDISYVLSPLATIMLEQLLLYSETLHNKTLNRLHADVVGWEHQVWENTLSFFVHKPLDHLFEDIFDAASFLHRLVHGLSGDNDTAPILRKWHEILKQEHGQEKIALQNIIVDAISTSQAGPQDFLSGEEVWLMVDALKRGFEQGYRQLKTAFHSGQLMPGKLTENELKSMIQALLKNDPALTDDNSRTFINAIETQAYSTENNTLYYYQRILEKLLRGQMVDLESIASRSKDVDDPVLTETGIEYQSTMAAATSYQRIRTALVQSKITGTGSFLEQLSAANAQTIQKHLLDLLQQTEIRTQMIARLAKPILFDIIYLLSPQAALVTDQLLLNAEMLFQYTPKKYAVHVAEWEHQIWENSFSYLLAMPIIDASAGRLNTLAFIGATSNGLSDCKDNITVIQSWLNALTNMQGIEYGRDNGTRVLRHSIETLLIQQKSGLRQKPGLSFHHQPLTERNGNLPEQVSLNNIVGMGNEDRDNVEFYIHNAGQVLAAPYLPQLFNVLGLIEKGVFINPSAAEHAVHLLQFMVNEATQSPEYQLLLNKILCGLSTAVPICNRIEISQRDRETVENLIQGMIHNWKTIGNTSIQGLRETFLQRSGRLLLRDEMWFLTIEPGPFDMLLDQLPWSFSVIKYSWMERAIHVTWR